MGSLRAYTASLDTAIVVAGAEEAALTLELSVFRRFRKSHDRLRNSVITRTHQLRMSCVLTRNVLLQASERSEFLS